MIDYVPGKLYREGWDDRITGRGIRTLPNELKSLQEEYQQGYNDCHKDIIEKEKSNLSTQSYLSGHPLYQESTRISSKTFLSD
jgi:hypothetical protein